MKVIRKTTEERRADRRLRKKVKSRLKLKSRREIYSALLQKGFARNANETREQWYARFLGTTREAEIIKVKKIVRNTKRPIPIGAPHPDYIRDTKFYESREWRELRYRALKIHGATCQCCGATWVDGALLHVDHIQPRYKRPDLSLDINNLQVLCEECNVGKGAWDATDWRQHFKSI